jgi:hypothetical protein
MVKIQHEKYKSKTLTSDVAKHKHELFHPQVPDSKLD